MGLIEMITAGGLLLIAITGICTVFYIKKELDKQYKEWKQKN